MKKLLALILCLSGLNLYSQCTDGFFPFKEGVSFEQTAYDKKGKEQGKTNSKVLSIENSSAIVENTFFDKKGEEVANGEYTIICEGNVIKMDFNNFIPKQMLDQYGNAEITVEGDFITIPDELESGQILPDGSGTVIIRASGIDIKMDIEITDRKVEKAETLSTSAGSFDTYKILQKTLVKMNLMGMNKTTESLSASWFAKGAGMIKNESYNKKGDLMGYTLLTAFEE